MNYKFLYTVVVFLVDSKNKWMNEWMDGCSYTKNEFDKRKQECLVQKFGLRRFQKLAWRDSGRVSISTPRRRRHKEPLFAGWDRLGSGLMRWYSVKKHQQLSVKCFFKKHKFGFMTPLQCEKNRCTVLRNTTDRNDRSARKMYVMSQFK